jgi:hypothetical protein
MLATSRRDLGDLPDQGRYGAIRPSVPIIFRKLWWLITPRPRLTQGFNNVQATSIHNDTCNFCCGQIDSTELRSTAFSEVLTSIFDESGTRRTWQMTHWIQREILSREMEVASPRKRTYARKLSQIPCSPPIPSLSEVAGQRTEYQEQRTGGD